MMVWKNGQKCWFEPDRVGNACLTILLSLPTRYKIRQTVYRLLILLGLSLASTVALTATYSFSGTVSGNVTGNNGVTSTNGSVIGGSDLDHIEIDHTGNALTCHSPSVTVKAYANAACSSLYTGG